MKNLTFLALALLLSSNLFAQKGLELTAGFTPGLSFIINDEDFAAGKELNIQPTFGYQAGLTLGYNFNDRIGIASGIGLASLGQNYTTDFDNVSKDNQITFDRKITYIRVPLLFRVGGDPKAATSAFFRFGPHFDFLSSAIGTTYGTKNNPIERSTNYRDLRKFVFGSDKAEIYNSAVLGLTLEVGGRIRISDQMGILLLFHVETSLTNPEGEDVATHTFFPKAGTLLSPERGTAWNIMAGANISFQYVLSFN